jgi:hypothetical protein
VSTAEPTPAAPVEGASEAGKVEVKEEVKEEKPSPFKAVGAEGGSSAPAAGTAGTTSGAGGGKAKVDIKVGLMCPCSSWVYRCCSDCVMPCSWTFSLYPEYASVPDFVLDLRCAHPKV